MTLQSRSEARQTGHNSQPIHLIKTRRRIQRPTSLSFLLPHHRDPGDHFLPNQRLASFYTDKLLIRSLLTMVAIDTRFAMLAAQCMLTLVAVSPPVAAVAVRSPHSNHGEDAGRFHRLHSSVIPAPNEKKSNVASKKHKGHKSGASVDKVLLCQPFLFIQLSHNVTGKSRSGFKPTACDVQYSRNVSP